MDYVIFTTRFLTGGGTGILPWGKEQPGLRLERVYWILQGGFGGFPQIEFLKKSGGLLVSQISFQAPQI